MLRYRLENIDKILKTLDHRIVETALFRATNFAADKLALEISNRVRARYNISKQNFEKRMHVRRSTRSDLTAVIKIEGQRMGLVSFGATPKKVTLTRKPKKGKGRPWGRIRYGASVKIMKAGGKKLITSKSAFMARGQNNNLHVWYRDPKGGFSSKGRPKIIPMKMLSAPGMVNVVENEMAGDYQFFAKSQLSQEFDRQLEYLLKGAGKK